MSVAKGPVDHGWLSWGRCPSQHSHPAPSQGIVPARLLTRSSPKWTDGHIKTPNSSTPPTQMSTHVCVHTRARTHITTTKSPLRSCSPPQRDCCPFEAPTLLLRGPDPALQGLGHCSSLRPGGEDRATVQSSPCGSTAPSALPVGAAVKPRLTLRRVWSVPFLAQSS